MILAGTGHRPPKLGIGYGRKDHNFLTCFAERYLRTLDVKYVISGMATGWDQALADAAINCGILFEAAIPFEGMDYKWPQEGRDRFRDILKYAEKMTIVSPGPYSKEKFWLRDKYMVDKADQILALYDINEPNSGTGITVKYANSLNKPVTNLWETFCREKNQKI